MTDLDIIKKLAKREFNNIAEFVHHYYDITVENPYCVFLSEVYLHS